MAKKKVSRKVLLKEPDEFLTLSRRMLLFVIENKTHIALSVATVFGLIIIASGIRYFSNRDENMGFMLMSQAMEKYEKTVKDSGQDKAYAAVQEDFKKILDDYSGKTAAKFSRVLYGDVCYNSGDADNAIELYKKAVQDFGDEPSVKSLILSSLGYAYEKKKDYQTAAKYFEEITAGGDSAVKADAFFNLGRLYAQLGDKNKSTEAFKKIISDYPDYVYIELVKEKVGA